MKTATKRIEAKRAAPSTPVPDGVSGDWEVSTFTLDRDDVLIHNLRAIRDGSAYMMVPPGTYKRLTRGDTVVMSDTPMEIMTGQWFLANARGNVVVAGLGLGVLLHRLLNGPRQHEVKSVTVIENSPDVIRLCAPTYCKDHRVRVIESDATTWTPAAGVRYDVAWLDIWDAIDMDNLPSMTVMSRHYRKFSADVNCWSRDEARKQRREALREGWV